MISTEYAVPRPNKRCFLLTRWKRYGQLSNRNRFLFFPSRFPDIPRKISAYLRTDSPSGANTRNIRGYHKTLNINKLCLKGILSFCNMHHFGMRNGLYWDAKWCFSASEMGFIAPRNGHYQKAKRMLSDYDMGYIIRRFGLKRPLFHRF